MGDITRTQVSDYDVTWGSYSLGFVDKVAPALELVTKEIKVGTLGDIKIGERIIGLKGSVKVEAREIDVATINGLMAWNATAGTATPGSATASVSLVPKLFHKDLYDYAKPLLLHPTHMGSNTAQDLTLMQAVPHMSYLGERDGVKDNVVSIEFTFYPNRADLLTTPPVVNYGYIGTAPP